MTLRIDRARRGIGLGFSGLANGGTEFLLRGQIPWRNEHSAFVFHSCVLLEFF